MAFKFKLKKDNQTPPKTWWHTVKYFFGKNSDHELPPIDGGDKINFSCEEKAEVFNNFFLINATLKDNDIQLPAMSAPSNGDSLSQISASEKDVLDILKTLDVIKATGPDGISPKMLREAATRLAKPLTRLINMSLVCKQFPDSWKLTNVLPLYKKNEKTSINNYRPISLLSCVSKVMERVVFKYTWHFIRDNGLLSTIQSGFMPGDSTIIQLVHVYRIMSNALDKK